MNVVLKYRFKNFERGNAYAYRAIRQHNLLPRVLEVMWPAKQRARAAQANEEDMDYATKNAKRASQTLAFFRSMRDKTPCEDAFCVSYPNQVFLNKTFAAEKALNKARSHMCSAVPWDDEAIADINDCRSRHLRFTQGTYGMRAQVSYGGMLSSVRDEHWKIPAPRNKPHLFELRVRMVRCVAEAWLRMVFYWSDPRFRILDAHTGNPRNPFCEHAMEHVVSTLKLKVEEGCNKCVDRATHVFLHMAEAQPQRAAELSHDLALLHNVQTTAAEKQHLHAQESRPTRRRGRALLPQQLHNLTYRKSCVTGGKRLQQVVLDQTLKKHNVTMREFSPFLAKRRFGLVASMKPQKQVIASAPTRKFRATSPWHMFRKQHWSIKAKLGSVEYHAEELRIATLWRHALPEEKQPYMDDAARITQVRKNMMEQDTAGAARAQASACTDMSSWQQTNAMESAFAAIVGEMSRHPIWHGGDASCDFSSALRECDVLKDPLRDIEAWHKDVMSCDMQEKKKPTQSSKAVLHVPCPQLWPVRHPS